MFTVLEIAGGILLALIVLAALPKLIEVSIYAVVAVLAAAGLLFVYLMWNTLPAEALTLLAVILVVIFFYGYSKNKATAKEIARVATDEKAKKNAEFKIFLDESLERRKQREGSRNVN